MKIRKLTADYIFPISSKPIKNGILIIDEKGKIIDLIENNNNAACGDIEYFNGVLTPGFVNAHCHIELAHLKGIVPEHTGLPEFVCQIVAKRNGIPIGNAIFDADKEMYEAGIVAVGDITNNIDSIDMKSKSKIYYHSFLEVLAFDEKDAKNTLSKALTLKKIINYLGLTATITPHAPYSVSTKLFDMISEIEDIASVHNQETKAEEELFVSKTGELVNFVPLFSKHFDTWQASGKNSLQTLLPQYKKFNQLLLIHNTSSRAEDIDSMQNTDVDTTFVLCPRSNLYIENRLPNFQLFYDKKVRIALGTDSPASNHSLSILEEMKAVQKNFNTLPFSEILKWATINGATALNKFTELGSFEKGKTPGVNLIKNINVNTMQLNDNTTVQRII